MRHALAAAVLLSITMVAFYQVRDHQFTNWDDDQYLTENPRVQAGVTWDNIVWACTGSHVGNWHPLATLSHLVDCQLFGLDPGPPHLENVALHAINALLVYAVWLSLTAAWGRSLLVAALFAVHPLHVESVAWVSERKDLLCGLFWLLTIAAYASYVRQPNSRRYATVVTMFALALLSKPMAVTLPGVLLLLDFWPLRRTERIGRLVREKLPLFGLSLVATCITFVVQAQFGAVQSLAAIPWRLRVANAAVSYLTYIQQTLVPTRLACFYPLPVSAEDSWMQQALFLAQGAAAGVAVGAISWLAVRCRRQVPYLFVGWFWYVLTLAPVIGIVQVGRQAHADRYLYLPLVGLLVVLVWGGAEVLGRVIFRGPKWIAGLGMLYGSLAVAVCLGLDQRQVAVWHDSETLFRHALAVTGPNALAHFNLGLHLDRLNRRNEAVDQYRAALSLDPRHARAHNNLGVLLFYRGRLYEALDHYRAAVELDPASSLLRENLGEALVEAGLWIEAIEQLSAVVRRNPDSARAHYHLGRARNGLGQTALAAEEFRTAVSLKPGWAEAHNNLGAVYWQQEQRSAAVAEFDAALAIEPNLFDARFNRACVLAEQGRSDEARTAFEALLPSVAGDASREKAIREALHGYRL